VEAKRKYSPSDQESEQSDNDSEIVQLTKKQFEASKNGSSRKRRVRRKIMVNSPSGAGELSEPDLEETENPNDNSNDRNTAIEEIAAGTSNREASSANGDNEPNVRPKRDKKPVEKYQTDWKPAPKKLRRKPTDDSDNSDVEGENSDHNELNLPHFDPSVYDTLRGLKEVCMPRPPRAFPRYSFDPVCQLECLPKVKRVQVSDLQIQKTKLMCLSDYYPKINRCEGMLCNSRQQENKFYLS
jgi:hypothetical protein